jgi:hypothetical protein
VIRGSRQRLRDHLAMSDTPAPGASHCRRNSRAAGRCRPRAPRCAEGNPRFYLGLQPRFVLRSRENAGSTDVLWPAACLPALSRGPAAVFGGSARWKRIFKGGGITRVPPSGMQTSSHPLTDHGSATNRPMAVRVFVWPCRGCWTTEGEMQSRAAQAMENGSSDPSRAVGFSNRGTIAATGSRTTGLDEPGGSSSIPPHSGAPLTA